MHLGRQPLEYIVLYQDMLTPITATAICSAVFLKKNFLNLFEKFMPKV